MPATEPPSPDEQRRTRRAIRLWIAAGTVFALTVLSYSGAMVYLAERDYPGSVVNDYFKNFKKFNEFTDRLEQQEKLGWALDTSVHSLPIVGEPLQVQVLARDDQGRPLPDADVAVHFVRNVNSRHDRWVDMTDQGGGRYSGEVRLPLPGNWTIRTSVTKGGHNYLARRFLWVEEPLE
ncbi:MAG TPA: FixH family protein [Gammaproteobacteria bacterium]|nr:FixH family protein [Gammaproteobacteria bacterium]